MGETSKVARASLAKALRASSAWESLTPAVAATSPIVHLWPSLCMAEDTFLRIVESKFSLRISPLPGMVDCDGGLGRNEEGSSYPPVFRRALRRERW